MDKKEIYGIIYMIRNRINNKVYIGQTTKKGGFRKRYNRGKRAEGIEKVYNYHIYNREHGLSYNSHLLNAIEKYGFKAFEVIEEFDIAYSKEELDELEIKYIKEFNCINPNGYNHQEGGKSHKLDEETRQKISTKNKGKVRSEEAKKRISEGRKGIKFTEEHVKNMSLSRKGKRCSEETKNKLRIANSGENNYFFGKHFTEEHKKHLSEAHKGQNGIPIYCEEFEEVRSSASEWGKQLGINRASITNCCKGRRKSTHGYHFHYATEEEIEKYKKKKEKENELSSNK